MRFILWKWMNWKMKSKSKSIFIEHLLIKAVYLQSVLLHKAHETHKATSLPIAY